MTLGTEPWLFFFFLIIEPKLGIKGNKRKMINQMEVRDIRHCQFVTHEKRAGTLNQKKKTKYSKKKKKKTKNKVGVSVTKSNRHFYQA
jgi:hypothetical protein